MSEYSDAERRLFDYFGYGDLTSVTSINVTSLYRMCVEKAFISNMQGPEVEALRRGAKALLQDARPYRMTPEFETLIKVRESVNG